MRLKKLYVENYKNLKDFTLDFESGNGLSILIGNNGSGKSNLLEIISGIFHDLFKEKSSRKIDCDYTLEYVLDDISCKAEQRDGTLRCYAPKLKPRDKFISENAPNSVIGLYSGEEDRLWTQFYQPYYSAYIRRIKSNQYQGKMRLMLIDKRYWNIALLTLLLSNNSTLEPFISSELGIKTIDKILVRFDFRFYQSSNELLKSFIDRINPEHVLAKNYSKDDLRQGIYYDILADENGDVIVNENGDALLVDSGITDVEVFRYLTQASIPEKDRLITGITISVNNGITIQQLSEGEKKLILVKTVLEILADEKALVLMDEPDAHLHEIRKKNLYSIMSEYTNRQIVLATHSPTFVDVAEQEQVKMLKTDADGNVVLYEAQKIEAIRELTGSRFNAFLEKPILFCEGTSSSVEAELYPVLFPDFKVIPSGGHEEVIRNVKGYNAVLADETHKAIGIIDWDYKNNKQLSALKEEGIYSLKVVEIENVLMDILLLNVAKEQFCSADDSIDKVKKCLFEDCRINMEHQSKKYTANRIVSKIKSQITADGRTIEDFKENILHICDSSEIDKLYCERLTYLEQMVEKSEYEKMISIYDFNHHIDRFVKDISNDYKNKILRLIKKRTDLQEKLKQKYYSDVSLSE